MTKSTLKHTFFIIAAELITALVVTIIGNIFFYGNRFFLNNFINFIFFVNLPLFILGSMMYIGESGLFNVFIYTTYKVRSVVSEKYRYTLQESDDVRESEIDEHLKNKYLYQKPTFSWTLPIFFASTLILIGTFISVAVFYGI